jgi:DNA helicase IV
VVQRQARLDQIKSAMAMKKLSAVHDAIVLDEAQDYLPEELSAFFKLGRVVFAAADGRQQIYPGMTSPDDLEALFKSQVYRLKHHYRNGPKICEVADELAKPWGGYEPLKPTSNYDDTKFPSSIEVHQATDLASQLAAVIKLSTTQAKAYPDELIGILCPTRAVLKEVWKQIESSTIADLAVCQSATEGYVPFQVGKPICVSTIHGAKGLEFRAAHIVSAECIRKSSLNRSIAYTGITRAKTSLSIHHSATLPTYLEGALVITKPPVRPAKLHQLFGKKK